MDHTNPFTHLMEEMLFYLITIDLLEESRPKIELIFQNFKKSTYILTYLFDILWNLKVKIFNLQ